MATEDAERVRKYQPDKPNLGSKYCTDSSQRVARNSMDCTRLPAIIKYIKVCKNSRFKRLIALVVCWFNVYLSLCMWYLFFKVLHRWAMIGFKKNRLMPWEEEAHALEIKVPTILIGAVNNSFYQNRTKIRGDPSKIITYQNEGTLYETINSKIYNDRFKKNHYYEKFNMIFVHWYGSLRLIPLSSWRNVNLFTLYWL